MQKQAHSSTGWRLLLALPAVPLTSFASGIGRWLPGAAASSMSGVAPPGDANYLPMWGAALLFTAYGLAFAALGSRLIMRRDIS